MVRGSRGGVGSEEETPADLAAEEMKVPAEELMLKGSDVVSTKDPAKLAVTAVPGLQRQRDFSWESGRGVESRREDRDAVPPSISPKWK